MAEKIDSGHPPSGGVLDDDKVPYEAFEESRGSDTSLNRHLETDLNMTEKELKEAKALAEQMTLDEVKTFMTTVLKLHDHDPNFPHNVIEKIKEFLGNDDVFLNPQNHAALIYEIKLEAAMIRNDSPYAEVRAVVDNHDDPSTPCSTARVWVIGLAFSAVLGFVNQLFSIRQPTITVMANVAQLLAYPIGKAFEKTLPDWGVTVFGTRHSLNPGPFSKKEHMLITIMANVAYNTPYTNSIIWTQYLPQYFNQPYAGQFSYQILIALGTNFIGYGMAGLTRRFLVYPSYCVWPASLVTIALNQAFHDDNNNPVRGPRGLVMRASRYRFFMLAFAAMFVYFWFPNYIFTALSIFSWMSWIAPNNTNLNAVVGMNNGIGLNPWPTFDWNILLFDNTDPLMVPFFSTFNKFLGMFLSAFVVLALWYSNAYHTGYLPLNSNRVFDNTGALYNVSRAVDARGLFDAAKYEAYSPAYMAAGNLTIYIFFFAIYPATLLYIYLYHRFEVAAGLRNLVNSFRKGGKTNLGQYQDVHNRLMGRYKEVPEWWYMVALLVAIAFGIAGISGYETYTTPAVVFYGLVLCLIFVVPVGLVKAMTGLEVTLNVLAEFIGGSWVEGNALAMNYFKSFGYVTCAHAVWFAQDLKMAHYLKIPPRHTFWAQMVATLVSTFVCVGVLNFQMNQIPGVCTEHAPNHYTCPSVNTFFTASVLWGTIGPKKVFGAGGQYTALLVGWPLGLVITGGVWALQRSRPKSRGLRQLHPVAMLYGALYWAPYNLSYVIPAVPVAAVSWLWAKPRYLGLWSKYNFVLSASFGSAVAVAAIIMFFSLQWTGVELDWWGNSVVAQGCENDPCVLKTLAEGDIFGPGPGEFH